MYWKYESCIFNFQFVLHQLFNRQANCCNICNTTPGCKGFAWNNHEGGTCWLKAGSGPLKPTPGVNVGILNSAAAAGKGEQYLLDLKTLQLKYVNLRLCITYCVVATVTNQYFNQLPSFIELISGLRSLSHNKWSRHLSTGFVICPWATVSKKE